MYSFYLIVLFAGIVILDTPRLRKRKSRKELFVYAFLLGLSFILCELYIYRVPIWGPSQLISAMVRTILS